MYEGQIAICKDIIEENWLEYLAFVKKQYDEELERQKKRMERLAEFDAEDGDSPTGLVNVNAAKLAEPGYNERRYYDINLNSFWSWYITAKVTA